MRTREDSFGLDGDDLWLSEACRALGHPARVKIVRELAHREYVCGDIVDMVPLSQSTVSQHLRVLRQAGLIQGQVEGPRVCYRLDTDSIRRLGGLMGSLGLPGKSQQSAVEPERLG